MVTEKGCECPEGQDQIKINPENYRNSFWIQVQNKNTQIECIQFACSNTMLSAWASPSYDHFHSED